MVYGFGWGASNHMTSRGEWFRELKDPKTPGYVEIGDDTAHPIAHIGKYHCLCRMEK